ncbi:MAG: transcription-repair coupling factor [Acidaminococcaceae bacterium]
MRDELISLIKKINMVREAAGVFSTAAKGLNIFGLADTQKGCFLAALASLRKNNGPLLFVLPGRDEVRYYRRELNYFYPEQEMLEFYPENLTQIKAEAKNQEVAATRIMALRAMYAAGFSITFVTAEALLQRLPSVESIFNNNLVVKVDDALEQEDLIAKLVKMGYERTEQVEALGQFCLRGDIMDIYPINELDPIRIEWFDNNIDALRSFDIKNQRALNVKESVEIVSLGITEKADDTNVFAYLSPMATIIMDEPAKIFETLRNLFGENIQDSSRLFTPEEIMAACEKHGCLSVSALPNRFFSRQQTVTMPVRAVAPYNRNIDLFVADLRGWLNDGLSPLIMMGNIDKAKNMAESLKNRGLPAAYVKEGPLYSPEQISVFTGELSAGFRSWEEPWLLLTENDIFGVQKKRRIRHKQSGAKIQFFSEIKAGDYVVHAVHGIGRYVGVETLLVGDVHRDYLLLLYANEDKLYVPVEQVSLLHKYIGNEGQAPRLSKMGGSDWKRITNKAKAAITELASELLRLYAQRKIVSGHAFRPDTEMQREFEAGFPFEETPDQLQAIEEIKGDMEKPIPMDRLLCGDVGYGKTEVAIRAAFKAVTDGKQVAVLVPTTVLAQQHFMTFTQRMEPFGVNVELISRFRTPREQRATLKKLREGQVDVLIGTHRILQSDVQFNDLGLLIIDEEQRFGVGQKEKMKKWTVGVDVLTLSATPIPRTLHLALVNGRDMSIIESPPEDRLPVETYVAEYNDAMIKEALEREIRRGGRVYYVHNRVQGLEVLARKIRQLVPGISVRIAHGQMPEEMLEDAMIGFYEGKFDVLLSTTIIENGLDVPLANTIIIDGAENFGLSQLYQMRGRVGRSSRLAYAYFVYKRNKALSEIAEKRLQAIKDFTELGAGFRIAMRDLEIRGAGNLLGAQQHGHIAGIGFAAYCDLLEKTINQMKSGQPLTEAEPDPVLEMDIDAYIPDDYIENPRYKLELYRRFADMQYKEREDFMDEIIDRFGNPPEQVIALWKVAIIRSLCREIKITGIVAKKGEIRITFAEHTLTDPEGIMAVIRENVPYIKFRSGTQSQLIIKTAKLKTDALSWLEKTLLRFIRHE